MDSVKELLGAVRRIEEAVVGEGAVKVKMRTRMKDYASVLEELQDSTAALFKHELERLQDLFAQMKDLHAEHTAGPVDGRPAKIAKKINRGIMHESIGEALDAIDREVVRQFTAIAAKSSISAEAVKLPPANFRPPALPGVAAVPAGALALPHSYVERSGFQGAVDNLVNPAEALAPFSVVGMGGGGKSVLASAIVRNSRARQYFRGGIFWVRVGRGANKSLLPLLQGLAAEMGATGTDVCQVAPHSCSSLEQAKQHLAVVAASAGAVPRLVVLDDVWERDIVDVLLPLPVKVMVTTRDRSVVGVPGRRLELGDMSENEALQLLLKASSTFGQPGDAVRAQMTKVAGLCARLPLALAIAGSMSAVKGKGLTTAAWEELARLFESNAAKKGRVRGEQSTSLHVVLGASLDALSERKQEEMLKLAVLALGAVAPMEMLLNLWEIPDVEGTREEAEGLSNKCLLQDMGGGRYRVHDLLLEFLKVKIKAEDELVERATERQADFLRRLFVVNGYGNSEHEAGGDQGFYVLAALWRSAEKLSGNLELEVAAYRTSLEELESSAADVDAARSFWRIGRLFELQGKYTEAEPLYDRYQAIEEEILGPEHPSLATTLSNRAGLLTSLGKYAEAGPLYERSQAIREKALGPEHPDVAAVLNAQASLLQIQGKYEEAGPLCERSLAIREKALGPGHPAVAESLCNRADLLMDQGKYAEAEPLYERSQAIREKMLGPEHPDVAQSLHNRAELLKKQGKYAEADPLYLRAIEIGEKTLGPDHPDLGAWLCNRAGLLENQGMYAEADPLYLRAIEIGEKTLGPDHPDLGARLSNRAGLLESQGKYAEADPLYIRAIEIGEKTLGPDHPNLAIRLNNRAALLESQGKYVEADPLYLRSFEIGEKTLGPDHPHLATQLHNRAGLLTKQGKFREAEELYKRSLAIDEKVYGPDHPEIATGLNSWALLLKEEGKYSEAIPVLERALSIRKTKLGDDHHDTVDSQNSLDDARRHVHLQAIRYYRSRIFW